MKLAPRLALYLVITVLIGGFFTVNASASSLPGDSLYGLKLGLEQTRLSLSFDDDSKAELELEFEDERLSEVAELLGDGREEDVEFHGTIEEKGSDSWRISGIKVKIGPGTELKGSLEVGTLVKVEALTQVDGSLLALEIYASSGDDLDDDSDDGDLDDDSDDDDLDDDSDDDDLDDDSDDDDLDDDSDDEMDDSSDDEIDDSSDDEIDDSSDDDEEHSEDEEKEKYEKEKEEDKEDDDEDDD